MKRLSCFLLALGLALSLVVPAAPASADYQSQSNFWQWLASNGGVPQKVLGYVTGDAVCPDSYDGKHHSQFAFYDNGNGHFACTCAYCGETYVATKSEVSSAYDEYSDSLLFDTLDSSGKFIWHTSRDDFEDDFYFTACGARCEDEIFTYNGTGAKNMTASCNKKLILPISGYYEFIIQSSAVVNYIHPITNEKGTQTFVSRAPSFGGDVDSLVDIQFPTVNNVGPGSSKSFNIRYFYPVLLVTPNDSSTEEELDYIPRNYGGDYSVIGDNNEVFHHEETIFNEDNSTFYNPVTDTSTNITNWNYDYSTRTYTMTDDNGQEKTLTYGDDNIVINDGGNTFNLYYGDVSQSGSGETGSGESGSGGSGSGESGTGLISQVGQLLGTLVSGLLGGITAFLSAILSALTNLVEVIGEGFNGIIQAVLGWFAELPQLFHGFLEFLTAVFGYMPAQILSMLSFGVAAVVFVGILKALRR